MQEHYDWNVKTTYMMCKYAMPRLYQTKGVVVNIGGLVASRPVSPLQTNLVDAKYLFRNPGKIFAVRFWLVAGVLHVCCSVSYGFSLRGFCLSKVYVVLIPYESSQFIMKYWLLKSLL